MFGSSNKKESPARSSSSSSASQNHALNSLVAGTVVSGEIQSKSDIRIDGALDGVLNCEAKVIIGPKGKINGEVHCTQAVIEGEFTGSLFVKELLNIRENAHVEGEVRYSKLIVQPGAALIGDIRLNNKVTSNAKVNSKTENIVGTKQKGKVALA